MDVAAALQWNEYLALGRERVEHLDSLPGCLWRGGCPVAIRSVCFFRILVDHGLGVNGTI